MFEPVVLTARRDAGAGLWLVTLTPAPGQAAKYDAPGQFIEVRTTSGSGYFALAGELAAPSWEILVRNNGEASTDLTTRPEGTSIGVRGPLGAGFPLPRAHGKALVVAVAGSALAVVRPIMRERIAHKEGSLTSVYIGVRSAREIALVDDVAGWAHAGARLVLCVSRPSDDDRSILTEAVRGEGYVQRVISSDLEAGTVACDLAFAAGPAAMLEQMKALSSATLEVVTNV